MSTDLHPQGNGDRLVALRELFGLRLLDLSEALDVGTSFLSKVERGDKPFPEAVMLRAAAKYDLPTTFFSVLPPPMDEAIQTFKKNAKATVRDEKRISRLHKEASRVFRSVSEATSYRVAQLPSEDDFDPQDIEQIATIMRDAMGLGRTGPVLNSVRSLERYGVGVIDALDEVVVERARQDHVGISMPHVSLSRPLIAVVTALEGAEKRFTVMHELGHLILDRGISSPVIRRRDVVEKRADRFARAMLLPAEDMTVRISPTLNLHGYLRIKSDFGVRVDMIVKRGEELGLLDAHRAKSLYIQRSSSGWSLNEAVEVANETPIVLQQGLIKHYGPDPAPPAAVDFGTGVDWIRRWATLDKSPTRAAPVIDLAARRLQRNNGDER